VLRQKWSRGQVEARLANMPRCLIGMEACVGAHHLSRKLKKLGHDARLMPAKYVRPGAGNLEIKLIYYRGPKGECQASGWMTDSKKLATMMSKIVCEGGYTQIGKILSHVANEHNKSPIAALVFVGDAMEEKLDELCGLAGRLHVPAFMFQEGDDETAETAFREIARITHGAFARFDAGAADQLRDLLKAVAAFAVGGIAVLEGKPGAVLLLEQLKK
jgi:hypothetical protein